MPSFSKKPVVIEAERVGKLLHGIDTAGRASLPEWVDDAVAKGVVELGAVSIRVKTLEGEMIADLGDWLIRGVKGELYPCKPDIFAATYEAVDGAS